MWKDLTAKTPCVLIEMGQSIDPHDKVLLGNTELIAGALYRAICLAFNISYGTPTSPVINPPPTDEEIKVLKAEVEKLKKMVEQVKAESATELLEMEIECQKKINTYKEKIINFINSLQI